MWVTVQPNWKSIKFDKNFIGKKVFFPAFQMERYPRIHFLKEEIFIEASSGWKNYFWKHLNWTIKAIVKNVFLMQDKVIFVLDISCDICMVIQSISYTKYSILELKNLSFTLYNLCLTAGALILSPKRVKHFP